MVVFGFFLGLLTALTLAMTQFCGTDYSQTILIYLEVKIYPMLRYQYHHWYVDADSQHF